MSGTASDISRVSALGPCDESGVPAWGAGETATVRDAARATAKLFDAMVSLEAEAERIGRDQNLTDQGRRVRLAEAATAFARVEIEIARERFKALQAEARRAEAAAISLPEPTGDTVVNALRAHEVRMHLRGLGDGLTILESIASEIRAGRAEALVAAATAPLGLPGLDAAAIAGLTRQWIEATDPARLARADALTSAVRQMAGLVEDARRRAEQFGAPSALSELAAG